MISAVGHAGRKINMPTSDGTTYLVHEPSPHRACSTHLVCENATAAVKWAFATWLRDGTSCVLSKIGETLFCTGGRSIMAIKTRNGTTRWESSVTDRYGQQPQFGYSFALHPDRAEQCCMWESTITNYLPCTLQMDPFSGIRI
jgi:hypothetical protein